MRIIVVLIVIATFGITIFCLFNSHKSITQNSSTLQEPSVTIKQSKAIHMTISSPVFSDHATIPAKYTCDGESINPPLTFENVPAEAKSLALLVDDPDVPKNIKPDGVFDHWVVYNMDPQVKGLDENTTPPGKQGLNGSGQEGYTGPCPPDREHRYLFKLYALDTVLEFTDPSKVTKQMVLDKMQGHILEEAELVGLYNRPQNK